MLRKNKGRTMSRFQCITMHFSVYKCDVGYLVSNRGFIEPIEACVFGREHDEGKEFIGTTPKKVRVYPPVASINTRKVPAALSTNPRIPMGTEVEMRNESAYAFGLVGKVIGARAYNGVEDYLVEFYEAFELGHDGGEEAHELTLMGKDGHCWWCAAQELEILQG